jgi:hypothetical protein
MRVSHETIYLSLFVQSRGALRRELCKQLRSGRHLRRPPQQRSKHQGQGQIPNRVMISERPAEVADRAVPGHWEGDLLLGTRPSGIATLVERQTRYCQLVALPDGHGAEAVRDALISSIGSLPEQLRRSLTWDQGKEMLEHAQFTIDSGIQIYFCDPRSPWQRGSNENTNGLLRQYFPKRTDLNRFSQAELDAVAAELNGRTATNARLDDTRRAARRGHRTGTILTGAHPGRQRRRNRLTETPRRPRRGPQNGLQRADQRGAPLPDTVKATIAAQASPRARPSRRRSLRIPSPASEGSILNRP